MILIKTGPLLDPVFQAQALKQLKRKIIRFRNLLLKIHPKLMHQQKKLLSKELNAWMGENDQVDDILLMGLRVK